jgi:hypothetical protein
MTALPPGPMQDGFDWGRLLGSLGAGLSAAGSPSGGWSAFAPAVLNARQAYDQSARARRQDELLEQEARRQQEQYETAQRTANQDAVRREQQTRLWSEFLGPGMMSPQAAAAGSPGGGPMQPGTMQTASGQLGSGPMAGDFSAIPPHARRRAQDLGAMRSELQQTYDPRSAAKSLSNIPSGLGTGSDGIDLNGDGMVDVNSRQMKLLAMMGPDSGMEFLTKLAFEKPDKVSPQSSLAKLKADLDAGLIDDATYQAAVKKENYIAPREGPGLTERQRNALAAGLKEGTPEYQQYILGRDDNEGGGPFEGNAMDAQASNILLTGNPASPEYAAAYAHLAQPKVQFDPTTNRLVTVSPDLSWAAKPGQQGAAGGNGGPLPLMPGVTGNRAGPTAQNAQSLPQQSQPTIPGAETMQVPGATITSSPGTGLSAADRSKMRDIRANADSIKSALTRFKEVVKSSDWRDDLSAYGGGMTEGGRRLNSTYNSAALLTKAESLFNLGVLNGPDLDLIRRTLPDPSTLPGMLTSEDASAVAVDEIINLIDSRLAAFESQFGGGDATSPAGGSGGTIPGGTRVDQLPPGNWK